MHRARCTGAVGLIRAFGPLLLLLQVSEQPKKSTKVLKCTPNGVLRWKRVAHLTIPKYMAPLEQAYLGLQIIWCNILLVDVVESLWNHE